jgi:hypothetical protein
MLLDDMAPLGGATRESFSDAAGIATEPDWPALSAALSESEVTTKGEPSGFEPEASASGGGGDKAAVGRDRGMRDESRFMALFPVRSANIGVEGRGVDEARRRMPEGCKNELGRD